DRCRRPRPRRRHRAPLPAAARQPDRARRSPSGPTGSTHDHDSPRTNRSHKSMITAGLKLTPSGGIALLDEDRLVFNVEMQKIANGARYSNVDELDDLVGVMGGFGFGLGDVGVWAVDGWDGAENGRVKVRAGGVR